MSPRAFIGIKPLPHYRSDAFADGLRKMGFQCTRGMFKPREGDLLLSWNLYGLLERQAQEFRNAGATVLVAENGYLGGDANKHMLYAMARDGHNGSGSFPVDDGEDRFTPLGVEVKPWKSEPAGHVVVAGQRGIGTRQMASPHGWHDRVAIEIRAKTRKQVRVRYHTGRPAVQQAEDIKQQYLRGAYASVIWASALGVRSLVEGIPVFYSAPHWICAGAAVQGTDVTKPLMDDALRLAALKRMAHAQWTIEELQSGEAFARLLA
jgi:hypothetical protein